MSLLLPKLVQAVENNLLLAASLKNIELLLAGSSGDLARQVIEQLVGDEQWQELNDRFYKTLAFGTGGLRGRTVGKVVTTAEQGQGGPNGRPEYPCIGTACMNHFNLSRAMRGLISYVQKDLQQRQLQRRARLVIAHDTRHFSPDFAKYAADIAIDLGCDVWLFESARSTPQLSFAIRELQADSGVVLTASHNPSWDNGFKAYWNNGAQLVPPHDGGVIAEVNKLDSQNYQALEAGLRGSLTVLGKDFDQDYQKRLASLVLDAELLQSSALKLVFTSLHGTGNVIVPQLLGSLGVEVIEVAEQGQPDGRFPTVDSPNPENASALAMGCALAQQQACDLVIGTDPDADRMGAAVRMQDGSMRILTGNQLGSLMAWYRLQAMFAKGILNADNAGNAVMVKTFVTTQLQDVIARNFGVSVVNTLTGFKYIAQKLEQYEQAIPAQLRGNYQQLEESLTRELRLQHSKYFVFGGEESYGYLACDFVRDKDANAACLMLAEVAAWAKSRGKNLAVLLDELFLQYGVHLELGKSLVMEGAQGAAQIAALAASYSANPPSQVDGSKVLSVQDFTKPGIVDEENQPVPRENMIIVSLQDGRRFAVRPSGTEPKIKYYLYISQPPAQGELAVAMQQAEASLESLWQWLQQDAMQRTNS